MKIIASPGYGPLERLTEMDAPVPAPRAGEVRVRVVASALNPADYKVILGTLKFLHARNLPLVVGYDFSGTVEAVGPSVAGVTGRLGRLPSGGGEVLVTGVSGGVGSISVGVARKLGAKVTAVGSGAGFELARRLGAAEVIDRTQRALPGETRQRFDVVFDAAAAYRWRQWRGALKPGGAFVTTLPSLAFVVDKMHSPFTGTRVSFVNVKSRPADLALLASWLEDGLEVPVASTIPVREGAMGLAQLQKAGGRIAVRVADGF